MFAEIYLCIGHIHSFASMLSCAVADSCSIGSSSAWEHDRRSLKRLQSHDHHTRSTACNSDRALLSILNCIKFLQHGRSGTILVWIATWHPFWVLSGSMSVLKVARCPLKTADPYWTWCRDATAFYLLRVPGTRQSFCWHLFAANQRRCKLFRVERWTRPSSLDSVSLRSPWRSQVTTADPVAADHTQRARLLEGLDFASIQVEGP